eukprot:GHVU01058258.1.p1 GENE.GHVU01058258.1~~GHVU01058258.1.p1  ORF type:complete len:330 (+),score=59.51 GHVU01058258.1:1588-2577(+)
MLPMGGGKGGSDFDPKSRSEQEIIRFCQSFMTELYRHIGANTDVPAGDIGVGGREIGYMFGQYRRLTGTVSGVLTGKNAKWGGSLIRPEATGYGVAYFAQNVLQDMGKSIAGMTCAVSGSGNVAQFAAEKLIQLGGKVVTMSDSKGYIHEKDGLTTEKLQHVMYLKNTLRVALSQYCEKYPEAQYVAGKRPWEVPHQATFPCATQNEVQEADAENIIRHGVTIVTEGANMPTNEKATDMLKHAGVIYCPGKASNAGGVAVSGLEMAQNSQRLAWTRERVDEELQKIMKGIFEQCKNAAAKYGREGDYQMGANIAGFLKVADSVMEQGFV